jgi:tetraacyldisaccharide 4'-kinase
VDFKTPNAAHRFGDEPVLIADELGPEVPVWVGADRFTAGKQAEAAQSADTRALHLLDDGFQHRQLARSIDIALVTAEDLDDALLPAGNRREPLGALRRADIALLRENELPQINSRLRQHLRSNAAILTHRRVSNFPQPLGPKTAGARPLAFCGIARPNGFTELLANSGICLAHTVNFRDHHLYTPEDVERLVTAAQAHNATGFATTAKDWVKFKEPMRARLAEAGPVMIVGLTAELTDPERLLRELEARLG